MQKTMITMWKQKMAKFLKVSNFYILFTYIIEYAHWIGIWMSPRAGLGDVEGILTHPRN
jgi:hypothetical protein